MDNEKLKDKAFSSTIWKFCERILAQFVSFVVSIVIARILSPNDYTVVSLVTIFFTFANVFVSGGFNTALIQKKDCDKEDYSSVLFTSVLSAFLIYTILFFCAPLIANAYRQPILTSIIRIMGLTLPIYAVNSVWSAYISIHLQFRKYFFATIGGTIISGVVGIFMASNGFGAWALVTQQMLNTIVGTFVLVCSTRIPIGLKISFIKLKNLFSYGWKIFVSSVLSATYSETIPLVMGIKYSGTDLSYYTKGKSFPSLISTTTTSTISSVLFPVLSTYKNDKEILLRYTRKFIRLASFVSFPLMLGMFAVADNFVITLLTDKWLPAVPYIRIFCIATMFDVIHIGNCETIKAMGRSEVYLLVEIIKKTMYFLTIVLFLLLSNTPHSLAMAFIVCTFIAIGVNSVPNKKLIGYGFLLQIKDLLPNFILSAIMCVVVLTVGLLPLTPVCLLLIQVFIGILVYLVINLMIKNESLFFLLNALKRIVARKEQ